MFIHPNEHKSKHTLFCESSKSTRSKTEILSVEAETESAEDEDLANLLTAVFLTAVFLRHA